MVTDIETEKSALDDQKALALEKKGLWDAAKETLQTKTEAFNTATTAWNNRDQSQDGQAVNQQLEQDLQTATSEKNDADTAVTDTKDEFDTEDGKIQAL